MTTLPQPIDLGHLPVMTYRDQPVATTEMLAQFYGAHPRALRDNFRNNKGRFVEGKHYITLEGQELRAFRVCNDNIVSPFLPSVQARVINLWMQRGAARHAKILDTDQAWEVYEAMEDAYFQRGAQPQTPQAVALPPTVLTPEQYQAEAACLAALQARLSGAQIVLSPEEYADLAAQRLKVGKKVHLVRDLVGLLEAHGIDRKVAKALTGHDSNTIRQAAHNARKHNH